MEQSLAQKVNKIEVNIKICHVTYSVLRNLNPKDFNIGELYMEQNLKVLILQ